ncbi:hypothetical protein JCM15519_15750 [Fundidesulfovibrio butyratiphilus]
MKSKKKILMVFPPLGMSGSFVRHAPISLLYASSRLVKQGFDVEVFDARLCASTWREELLARLDASVFLVGISVMTGAPVMRAVEIAEVVKRHDPGISVVWGGPFATFNPEVILEQDPNTDYVVSGYGALPFFTLVETLLRDQPLPRIPGVTMRGEDGGLVSTPADWSAHEIVEYQDIPYDLIKDYSVYGQLDNKKVIFSLYSAMGCPYRCAFCSSPALYKNIKKDRWIPYSSTDVVDHIQHVVENYGAEYIYFIDDDSFVDLDHVERIIDLIAQRNIKVGLGFRGARINEIKKMSHDFIDKLVDSGTDILHIGAETGSDRLLEMVRKNCTVADILECNRKLAKHSRIRSFYNFILGLPTETMDDLKATCRLMLRLIEENPRCIISTPNLFRPLPGTELFDKVRSGWNFQPPKTLEEWGNVEVETGYDLPWVSPANMHFISMMLMSSYFIDNKINKMETGNTMFIRVLKLLNALYGPIARFRLKHGIDRFLLERKAYDLVKGFMS